MTRKKRRIILVVWGTLALAISTALVAAAMSSAIVFYVGPAEAHAQVAAGDLPESRRVRIGGQVVPGSWVRSESLTHTFVIGDGAGEIDTRYTGVIPDLFEEGQGVIAEGYVRDGVFEADKVLAKHDETYVPREVAEQLRRNGVWRGDGDGASEAAPTTAGYGSY